MAPACSDNVYQKFSRMLRASGGRIRLALRHLWSPLDIVDPPLHPGMIIILPF